MKKDNCKSVNERSGLPQRDVGIPCENCGCEYRRPETNHCAACGRFAPDPIYALSELTDNWYRVSEWESLGDGKIQAKKKVRVDSSEVPDAWKDALAADSDTNE